VINLLLGGLAGELTTFKWIAFTKAPQDTALRDIDDLQERDVLKKSGWRMQHAHPGERDEINLTATKHERASLGCARFRCSVIAHSGSSDRAINASTSDHDTAHNLSANGNFHRVDSPKIDS
jgi:hypothetical protein